jgi:hypothetical protein
MAQKAKFQSADRPVAAAATRGRRLLPAIVAFEVGRYPATRAGKQLARMRHTS